MSKVQDLGPDFPYIIFQSHFSFFDLEDYPQITRMTQIRTGVNFISSLRMVYLYIKYEPGLVLLKKLTDELLVFFVFDSSEEFCA